MDLGFSDFSENVDILIFPIGFGVWEGVQSIEASYGIKIDGFSARTKPYGFISYDVHGFVVFCWCFHPSDIPSEMAHDQLRVLST